MNRLSKPNQLAEYWFDGSQLLFADGDIGDDNHSSIVSSHAASLVSDEVNNADLRSVIEEWSGDPTAMRVALAEWQDLEEKAGRPSPGDVGYVDLLKFYGAKQPEPVLRCLVESDTDRFDAREVGIDVFKWVRIRGHNLLVHHLDAAQLRAVARALDDELFEDAPEDIDLGPYAEPTFDLETRVPQNVFRSVPLSVLLAGDLARLRYYGRGVIDPALFKMRDTTGG